MSSTQRGYQAVIDYNIIPVMGRMKVLDVKRHDVAALMKKRVYKPVEASIPSAYRARCSSWPMCGDRPDYSVVIVLEVDTGSTSAIHPI